MWGFPHQPTLQLSARPLGVLQPTSDTLHVEGQPHGPGLSPSTLPATTPRKSPVLRTHWLELGGVHTPSQGLICLMAHKTYVYWLVLHDIMKHRDDQSDEEAHRVRSLQSGGHPPAHGPLQFGFFMEPSSHRINLLLLNTLPSPLSKKWGRDGKVQASNHGRCFW